MKIYGLFAILACVAAAPAAAQTNAFNFRSLSAGTTIAEARSRGIISRCTNLIGQFRGSTHCFMSAAWHEEGVSGHETAGGGIVFGQTGTLQEFSAIIDRSAVSTVATAFSMKYGEPCQTRDDVLQNGFGARLPDQVKVWCFDDGALTLHSISPENPRVAKFEFRIKRDSAAPNVNF